MKETENITTREEAFETEEEVEVETTSRSEYISSAYYAIAAVSELDTELMSPEDRKRKKDIVRKSLRIIDNIISELDAELYEEYDEEE
jgi:flagellin-specific chaperone FliS